MPRPKRSSKVLDRAERRIAAIKSIHATVKCQLSRPVAANYLVLSKKGKK